MDNINVALQQNIIEIELIDNSIEVIIPENNIEVELLNNTINVTLDTNVIVITIGEVFQQNIIGGASAWGEITGTLANQTDLQNALNSKANATSFNSHVNSTSNPHSVTKSQIGLSNVDNTNDASKPVSTAQQNALDNIESLAFIYALIF